VKALSGDSSDWAIYRRLFAQARPYWPHLTINCLLSLLASPLLLLTPFPWTIVIDSVLGSKPLPSFLEAVLPSADRSDTAVLVLGAVLVILIALLHQLQMLVVTLFQSYTGEKLVLEFRARLFEHVQRLSLAYHDTVGVTDSTYRIQYDARSIEDILITGSTALLAAVFALVGMIYVMAWIDWQLALVALGVSPLVWMITQTARAHLRARWPEVKAHESGAMSVVQETLAAMRVVKAFGQEEREHDRFVRRSTHGFRGALQLAFIQGGASSLVGLTLALGTATVLFVGVRHVQSGVLTLGELVIVMMYLAQLYLPLDTMSKKVADLQSAIVGAERAFALLDEAPDVPERPHARHIERAEGAIVFRNVSFGYERNRAVLQDISFEARPGARVGIAGTTGGGKTTLVSLLTRFYDPTDGQILLDGVDLRDYRVADLRNQFAIVLQEPVLFSASLGENISYARPGASQDEVVAAAVAANAHDFITRLPQGYDTVVGERGMRLSGGERQRISLARAFLKDAPILILDEPTSSVDAITERTIAGALQRLIEGRTSFVISHRPGLLRHSDQMLIVENGQLASAALGNATLAG
jgi:ATP-binding cassette subfamily B protein